MNVKLIIIAASFMSAVQSNGVQLASPGMSTQESALFYKENKTISKTYSDAVDSLEEKFDKRKCSKYIDKAICDIGTYKKKQYAPIVRCNVMERLKHFCARLVIAARENGMSDEKIDRLEGML